MIQRTPLFEVHSALVRSERAVPERARLGEEIRRICILYSTNTENKYWTTAFSGLNHVNVFKYYSRLSNRVQRIG